MYKKMNAKGKAKLNLAVVDIDHATKTICLSGSWCWVSINENIIAQFANLEACEWLIDGRKIAEIDTTGFHFVHKIINTLSAAKAKVSQVLLVEDDQKLYDLTQPFELQADNSLNEEPKSSFLSRVGESGLYLWLTCLQLTAFFGQLCTTVATLFKRDYPLYVRGIVETISSAGIKGVLISSLLCFLIGVNLTYQMAPQFVTYGANIYVVNFLGISLLREVTPLLTAIIVAGRTGSAIAATIGSMKVQEEIDALQTMGISPMRRLVVPQVIGLVIALPILTMLADVSSMLGGMVFSGPLLGIEPRLFLVQLQSSVSINNFWVGIVKSFFFAWIIGMVGSFCGFRVKANSDSIGIQTTRSVVISICLIIFIDALFAILFKALGV